jgi:aminopeptidase
MSDPRLAGLADQLVSYSVDLQAGEKIYLEIKGVEALALGRELVRASTQRGAVPFWYYNDDDLARPFVRQAGEAQFAAWGAFHRGIMEQVDAYIAVRGASNPFDLGDVDAERMKWHDQAYWQAVHLDVRLKKKWCVLRYPNPSMAVLAQQPTEAFADFYFKVCTLDYARLSRAMDPLKELLERTDRVELRGPGTDLSFSIRGIPAVKCDGHRNIPDGEIYTAPVRDSMQGVIVYNAPSMAKGTLFRNIRLTVEQGRIREASCDGDDAKLARILDTDEGARYFGEFALGLNPYIRSPLNDTLFDEKIAGSFHLTPGNAYDKADNGNRSAVHWDLVNIQTSEWGGGEIVFDGVVVRRDGLFTLPELQDLNPEATA